MGREYDPSPWMMDELAWAQSALAAAGIRSRLIPQTPYCWPSLEVLLHNPTGSPKQMRIQYQCGNHVWYSSYFRGRSGVAWGGHTLAIETWHGSRLWSLPRISQERFVAALRQDLAGWPQELASPAVLPLDERSCATAFAAWHGSPASYAAAGRSARLFTAFRFGWHQAVQQGGFLALPPDAPEAARRAWLCALDDHRRKNLPLFLGECNFRSAFAAGWQAAPPPALAA